jgi:hypothetical protein
MFCVIIIVLTSYSVLIGIARPFSNLEAWRGLFDPDNKLEARKVFIEILMIQSHEKSIKPI